VLLLLAGACAPKAPPPAAGPDRFPAFVFPDVPPDLARVAPRTLNAHQAGWRWLQSGNLRNAERSFNEALKRTQGFYPAVAGLAYVNLAERQFKEAVGAFDRALSRNPGYVPALLGRGEALLALEADDEALASFEAALAADPSLEQVRQRVDVLRFRGLEATIDRARRAAQAGRLDEAQAAYTRAIAASPQSGFLHRDLAEVERQRGDLDAALGYVRRAIDLDAGDVAAHRLLGHLLEARDDLEGAVIAFERAQSIEPSAEIDALVESLRARIAVAALPAAYRSIGESERLTRGELAALIGVRLEPLLRLSRRPSVPLVTDARRHWARRWVTEVTRAGVMETYANHTFQPNAAVRRSELAQAVSRLLTVIASREARLASRWQGARPSFTDIGPGHLAYPAAASAVAAGILAPEDGAFRPSRPVTGAEGVKAIEALEALASPLLSRGARR
jgi:tetratricopeptide (TPR) repeat protein